VKLKAAPLEATDVRFPINLAAALRLADARPLIVAAAQAGVWVAEADLTRAKVLWVPTLNIGADSLRTGIPQHAGYNAAKGGVIGLMVGLAKEFAGYDITVNTVSPCVVNTERHRARMKDDPKLAEAFVQVVPKGRGVEIEEVCDMVAFLARRESGFMTGQDISLNGGSAMP